MQSIDITMTIDQPIPEAQAQILARVDPRLRAVGYAQHAKGNAVEYRPSRIRDRAHTELTDALGAQTNSYARRGRASCTTQNTWCPAVQSATQRHNVVRRSKASNPRLRAISPAHLTGRPQVVPR